MSDICPLLIRASFIGKTYHDFQLKFEAPAKNCSIETQSNPVLIQFTRVLNETFNESSYALYNPLEDEDHLPQLQVFHRDRVDLCIGSVLNTNQDSKVCHEFHMLTMLRSNDDPFWPMVLLSIYILILLICILFSSCQRLFRSSYRRKIREFFYCLGRPEPSTQDKRQFYKSVSVIAKECRPRPTFVFSLSRSSRRDHLGHG